MTTYHGNERGLTAFLDRCRAMRRSSTDAEAVLWACLRGRALAGAKFRRQHSFGPYILDFYCPERRLAIELDGNHHGAPETAANDAVRTAALNGAGIRVLRFNNTEIHQQLEGVLRTIWENVSGAAPSPPAPLPGGEGSYLRRAFSDPPRPPGEGLGVRVQRSLRG